MEVQGPTVNIINECKQWTVYILPQRENVIQVSCKHMPEVTISTETKRKKKPGMSVCRLYMISVYTVRFFMHFHTWDPPPEKNQGWGFWSNVPAKFSACLPYMSFPLGSYILVDTCPL